VNALITLKNGINMKDFEVECNVCGHRLQNWVGSTPCCGSIAYRVNDDNTVSKDFVLFAQIPGKKEIKPTLISTDGNSK